nr:MAG TPA: hypothetical protein [Microviridae sp.]
MCIQQKVGPPNQGAFVSAKAPSFYIFRRMVKAAGRRLMADYHHHPHLAG